jgi:hypothetical protein
MSYSKKSLTVASVNVPFVKTQLPRESMWWLVFYCNKLKSNMHSIPAVRMVRI